MVALLLISTVTLFCSLSAARHDNTIKSTIPDEKWDYVNVRPHAFMFWWFYGAQVPVEERANVPLVIWLQGGPGGSGTGFGNFMEIGPLDVKLQPREFTWLKKANLLFIDNPVGSGYSYVTDDSAYAKNGAQISEDLLTVMKSFFKEMPNLRAMPLFIFSESYGGKMAASFGVRMYRAIKEKEIQCRFSGVALGDSAISIIDSVYSYGSYLYQFNLLDDREMTVVIRETERVAAAYRKGMFGLALNISNEFNDRLDHFTDFASVYNVLKHHQLVGASALLNATAKPSWSKKYLRHLAVYHADPLTVLMNGPIKEKLGIPDFVVWGGQSETVMDKLSNEVFRPVLGDVSKLLAYKIPVVVYQGQLDMICNTPGAESWMRKLTWYGLSDFLNARKVPLYVNEGISQNTAAFKKEFRLLTMYYILDAGHMVPYDAPLMAFKMLGEVIGEANNETQ